MTNSSSPTAQNLEVAGCCLLKGVLTVSQIESIGRQLDDLLQSEHVGVLKSNDIAYGVRNLLQLWPSVVELARIGTVYDLVQQHLGSGAGVVRALLFDKPPEKSWALPWHRDRTIAIAPGFTKQTLPACLTNLTLKAGVHHALASDQLLSRMLTLRISIDPMTSENGPLFFIPGSHRLNTDGQTSTTAESMECTFGSDEDLEIAIPSNTMCHLECDAGDLFVMRPLLAHSSKTSSPNTTRRRRVIHIELAPAGQDVPWFEFVSLQR